MTATVRLLSALLLSTLLVACQDDPVADPARPVLVVRADAGGAGLEAYSGEVHAREEPALSFRVAGKIQRRLVDAGARVRAGQALAELDPADLRLQSEAQRASLASADAELALARAEADRHRDLAQRQLVSQSLYETRLAQLRAAESRQRQARAALSQAGNQLGYAVLRAPQDGLVVQRLAEAGQVVAAGQPVFLLATEGGREVQISVPEQKLAQFPVGRSLLIELWAEPGQRVPGQVREVSAAADPQTRTFQARIAFSADGAPSALGQSARVYVPRAADAGLRIPLSALGHWQDRPVAWVVDPASSRLRRVPLRVGVFSEQGVPVLAGLAPGDWVVAAGVHLLREGQPVQPIDRDNRPVRLRAAQTATR